MTDREKVRLCRKMIREFWEYSTSEEDENENALSTVLNCIDTVLAFGEEAEDNGVS